jgi:ectoine hydroxylase-related dioxygenase (phytanoyl-CoA dioxygenase family)
MDQYKLELFRQGYTVVPNIISQDLIKKLRDKYIKLFESKNISTLLTTDFLAEADIADLIFSSSVIQTIASIVGKNYCIYPDFTLRQNLYIPWHTDTSYLSIPETDNIEESNMVQMSIYLQDNTYHNGGGLEVIPGSHRHKNINRHDLRTNQIDFTKSVVMPSTAGSLVFWDSRLLHKSREPHLGNTQPKLAIQWTISKNDLFASKYLQFLNDRINSKHQHISDNQGSRENNYLNSMKQISYPSSFNDYQISNINKYGLKLRLLSDMEETV